MSQLRYNSQQAEPLPWKSKQVLQRYGKDGRQRGRMQHEAALVVYLGGIRARPWMVLVSGYCSDGCDMITLIDLASAAPLFS